MKKLFTTCAILFGIGLGMQAQDQMLATFEDADQNLLEVGTKWYEAERFVVEPEIGLNTDQSGLNTSSKCFKAVNVADADWWGNFGELKLTTPITITENNKYLKMLAYRSIQPKEFRVAVNGDHERGMYFNKLTEDGKWEGIVVDLSSMIGEELTSIVFIFSANWNDPRSGWGPATYMFDDICLSDNMIPPGNKAVDPAGFHISFDDSTLTDKWVKQFDLLNESNSYEIVDNPSKEVNKSSKVVKFNKGADASWWQGFRFVFNNLLDMNVNVDNKYLHTMVYIPEEAFMLNGVERESLDVMFCAKDFTGRENNYTHTFWNDEYNMWMDIVMEINQISYVKELTIRFDVLKDDTSGEWVNSPANTYFFDDIIISDSLDPRAEVEGSGINSETASSKFSVKGAENEIIVNTSGADANVKVYNASGVIISNVDVSDNASIAIQKGFYVVKVQSGSEVFTQKVLVK